MQNKIIMRFAAGLLLCGEVSAFMSCFYVTKQRRNSMSLSKRQFRVQPQKECLRGDPCALCLGWLDDV